MYANVLTGIRRHNTTQKLKRFVRENRLFSQICFKSCSFCLGEASLLLLSLEMSQTLPSFTFSYRCLSFCCSWGRKDLKLLSFFNQSVSNLATFYTYTLIPFICWRKEISNPTLFYFERSLPTFWGGKGGVWEKMKFALNRQNLLHHHWGNFSHLLIRNFTDNDTDHSGHHPQHVFLCNFVFHCFCKYLNQELLWSLNMQHTQTENIYDAFRVLDWLCSLGFVLPVRDATRSGIFISTDWCILLSWDKKLCNTKYCCLCTWWYFSTLTAWLYNWQLNIICSKE